MPTRVIAVTNFKGGIGKTTTTVNVGAGFALKGARLLLVDIDPQGNLGHSFGVLKPKRTLYDVLVDNRPLDQCLVQVRPNIDLLPADDTLLLVHQQLGRRSDWSRVLELALRPVARNYDFVLLDCSASLNQLNASAISAATDILVPTALEHLAIQGVEQLCRNVTRIKGTMGAVRMIIPTMVDARQRQAEPILRALQERFGDLVTTPVRVNVRLSEAPAHGQTIYEYDPRSRGSLEYAALVEQLSQLFGWTPVQRPAEAPAPPVASEATPSGALPTSCPDCGSPIERLTVASTRVLFCPRCKWKMSLRLDPLSRPS